MSDSCVRFGITAIYISHEEGIVFTFVILTYNHAQFIVQHLESIKYQIKNFGNDRPIRLILCDDFSQDNTVKIAEAWLHGNRSLFSGVSIEINEVNQGIVSNYLKALDMLDCSEYKLLAGDDMYFANDIFGVIGEHDLLFTPVVKFEGNTIIEDFAMNFLIRNKTVKRIRKWLKVGNMFSAPGVFFRNDIMKERGLREQLSKYKWIEDLPTWHYFFYVREEINYAVDLKPYVMYRISSGITKNYTRNRNSEFYKEVDSMRRSLGMHFYWLPLNMNPYKIYRELVKLRINYIDTIFCSELAGYHNNMRIAHIEAGRHLNYIRCQSLNFIRSMEDANGNFSCESS